MKHTEIQLSEIWNDEKENGVTDFIINHSQKQLVERKLRNEMLAIQFLIEDYINTERVTNKFRILDFVKMYLKIFNVTQKKLADLFEMKDSNLHKYLIGERKLNTNIVLKLSAFSNLTPEYWLRIEVKNELIEIIKEKEKNINYNKYHFSHLLAPTANWINR